MIEKIGTRLGQYFYRCNYIAENDIDAVRYYVEVFFNEYIQLMLTILLGYYLNKLVETILYLFCFILIRKYAGGYHAKTITGCNVIAYLLYFIALYLSEISNPIITIILIAVSILYLFKHGSCYSKNQREFEIKDSQTKKMKFIVLILWVLFSIALKGQYLMLFSITLFEITLLNIVKERGSLK